MVANPRPRYSPRVGTGFVVAGVVVAVVVALSAVALGLARRARRARRGARARLGLERHERGGAGASARSLEASITRLERRVASAAARELEAAEPGHAPELERFDLDDGLGPLSLEARRVVQRARALAERENETIRLERQRG
jgi:hypothetical protein